MQRTPPVRRGAPALRRARLLAAAALSCACEAGRTPPRDDDASVRPDAGDRAAPLGQDAGSTRAEAGDGGTEGTSVSDASPPLQHFVCPGGGIAHRDPTRPSCPECKAGLWRLDPGRLVVRIPAGSDGVGIFYVGELPDETTFTFDALEVYRGERDAAGNVPRAQKVFELPWQPARTSRELHLFRLIPTAASDGDALVSGQCPDVKASVSELPAEPALPPIEPEGALVRGVWWHLAEVGWSCDFWCMDRDGQHGRAEEVLYGAPEGEAAETCQTILHALGVAGTVRTSDLGDGLGLGLGLGCHTTADGSLWWMRSPPFNPHASAPESRLVCGCSL